MSTSCIIRELNWSRCLSRTSRWLLEFWEYYLDYSVSASGGPFGGSFSLTTRNLEKLAVIGGSGPIALPTSKSLEPFETYSATFECEGTEASDSEGDC